MFSYKINIKKIIFLPLLLKSSKMTENHCMLFLINISQFLKIFRAEKDNQTEISVKLSHLKTSINQLRESVNSTLDIRRSIQNQNDKISDIHRQISIKNNYFRQFKH